MRIVQSATLLLATLLAGPALLGAPKPPPPMDPLAMEDFVLTEAEQQVKRIPARPRVFQAEAKPITVPADYAPWWIRGQRSALGSQGSKQSVSLESLFERALRHSSQIRVFSDLPLIRETGIQEAAGAFDTNAFLQTKFDHRNDPVGSTLTTGNSSRFREDDFSVEGGVRKKLITGTEVSLTQEIGRTENNSIYFVPDPQTRAQLTLSVVQPLLRGAGTGYNKATMQIARIDSEVAMSEFIRQSESHLLEITRTYWALYAARVTYLQKQKLVEETSRVTEELRGRQQVDAQATQLFRAESALASRRADLIRSEAAVRNAQDRLKALTSDPELLGDAAMELIPADRLILGGTAVDARLAAQAALEHRPEISQAFMQMRAAAIREKVSRNELLPELNLVLSGSLGGLEQDDFGRTYTDQFSAHPGYGAGLVFSFPFENKAARARHERRQVESRQLIDQLRTTIDTVLLEVKVSAREVATAQRETQAKYEAVRAFTADIETLEARRTVQALQDVAQVSGFLDDVLDAQSRRATSEEDFIRAAANYQIAIVNLERSKGNLLAYQHVSVVRGKDQRGLPKIWLEKAESSKSMK